MICEMCNKNTHTIIKYKSAGFGDGICMQCWQQNVSGRLMSLPKDEWIDMVKSEVVSLAAGLILSIGEDDQPESEGN